MWVDQRCDTGSDRVNFAGDVTVGVASLAVAGDVTVVVLSPADLAGDVVYHLQPLLGTLP